MAHKTIPDIKSERNLVARTILSYALLESVVRAIDNDDAITSFGERIQRQEEVLGIELLRKVNFALGVRNRLSHSNDVPTNEEMNSAAEYFLESVYRHLPYLTEEQRKYFLGSDYQPPQRKTQAVKKTKRHKKKKKAKCPIKAMALLNALVNQDKAGSILDGLVHHGFEVSALRVYVPNATQLISLKAIRSIVTRVVSPTSRGVKAKALQECQYLFDPSIPAHNELRAIVESFLVWHGRHPRTGQYIEVCDRPIVVANLRPPSKPTRDKPWWQFW